MLTSFLVALNLKKNPKSPKAPKKRALAFSLLEVSVVIIIIGVLIAGVISAKALIKKARLASAQSLTRTSPVNSIPGSVIWLESSLDNSFNPNESNNGSTLTGWSDIKISGTNPNNSAVVVAGSDPTKVPQYSNTINNIHAVRFFGADDSYLRISGDALNNSAYTIIVLEKRQADGTNYFLEDDGSSTADNQKIKLGYKSGTQIIQSQGSSNEYESSVGGYSSWQNPRLFVFTSDLAQGKKPMLTVI